MKQENDTKGEVVIYKDAQGPGLEVSFSNDSVWLSQTQMADLFDKDQNTISEHIQNVYKEGELAKIPTTRKFRVVQTEGKRQVLREIEHYNLDVIISVGYRVKSKRGTQFRIWATQKLNEYLHKGYVINEKRLRETQDLRLKELESAHKFIQKALNIKRLDGYEKELVNIISDYTNTWVILNRYDEGDMEIQKFISKPTNSVTYIEAKKSIEHFKARLLEDDQATSLFGHEIGHKLADIIENTEHIKSPELLASTIFYEVIKKRPFHDGNSRIASLLFILQLIKNQILYDKNGERKFNDNGLIAIALLATESKPGDRDTIINLITNLVTRK